MERDMSTGVRSKKAISSTLAAVSVALATTAMTSSAAHAALIESFETGANGYTISPENGSYVIGGTSTTTGVTDGLQSLIVSGTGNPTYGQMLVGTSTLANTAQGDFFSSRRLALMWRSADLQTPTNCQVATAPIAIHTKRIEAKIAVG